MEFDPYDHSSYCPVIIRSTGNFKPSIIKLRWKLVTYFLFILDVLQHN